MSQNERKELSPWIYNRLIINNDSQKHNYICKYNNLPTTCFGLIRSSSGWNTASEENYLFDLNVSGKGGGRDLVYKYGDSGWNGVGTRCVSLVVGCPAGLVLEAWWPGVGNSRYRMATVRVLLWRVHSVLGDQVGVWALLLRILK